MTFPKLFVKELSDTFQQSNAGKINTFFTDDAVTRCGFEFLTYTTLAPATDLEVPHYLGYLPLDIIITGVSAGTASINQAKTTATSLFLTTSTGATVRLLAGRYG